MLTQLRFAGLLSRAAAVVFGELPRCDEPGGRRSERARGRRGRPGGLSRAGAVRAALRSYDRRLHDAALWRARARHRRERAGARAGGGRGRVMKRIHLIGICGTAMATLAAMLKARGLRRPRLGPERLSADERLPGGTADRHASRATRRRTSAPISIWSSWATPSRAAIPSSRKCWTEISGTARCPKRCATTFLWASRSIVIAGTHGKTTTTSLTGWLLTHGGADPSVLIGGIAENFAGSYRIGGGREFVIEGDEYDSAFFDKTAKFLKYLPDIVVVNNIEYDHADIYPDLESIRRGLPPPGQSDPASWPAAASAPTTRGAARWRRPRDVRSRRSDCPTARDWQAHDLDVGAGLDDIQRAPQADAGGAVRAAAARRLQRPERAGGARGRRRGRA